MSPKIKIGKAYGAAWRAMENKLPFAIGIFFLAWCVEFFVNIPGAISNLFVDFLDSHGANTGSFSVVLGLLTVSAGFSFVTYFVQMWMVQGQAQVSLDLLRSNTSTIKRLFAVGLMPYVRYVLFSLLLCIIIIVGMGVGFLGLIPIVGYYFSLAMADGAAPTGALFGLSIQTAWIIAAAGFLIALVWATFWSIRFCLVAFILLDGEEGVKNAMKKSFHLTKGNVWHMIGFAIVNVLITLVGFMAFGIGLLLTGPLTFIAFAEVYRQLNEEESVLAPLSSSEEAVMVQEAAPLSPAPQEEAVAPEATNEITPPVSV